MKEPDSSTLPAGRTPEAQQMREVFIIHYKAELDKIRRTPLDILVWGPGQTSGGPVRQKRIQIRDELLKHGHNAMFSEELEELGGDLPLKLQELAQARLAHMIITLLEDAPGALGETHDFTGLPDVAWRFYLLVPNKYQDGYSARGAVFILSNLFNCVYWYGEGEIESCSVLTNVLRRVELVQHLIACTSPRL